MSWASKNFQINVFTPNFFLVTGSHRHRIDMVPKCLESSGSGVPGVIPLDLNMGPPSCTAIALVKCIIQYGEAR